MKLRIDGRVYEGALEPLEDAERIERLRSAYRAKYELEQTAPNARYWRFVSSSGE